jgi:hypothetical protein
MAFANSMSGELEVENLVRHVISDRVNRFKALVELSSPLFEMFCYSVDAVSQIFLALSDFCLR